MNDTFLLGDIHGDFTSIYRWINKFAKRGDTLIQLGDFGAGLVGVEKVDKLARALERKRLKMYVLRGNHDYPGWFDSDITLNKSLHFVRDYTCMQINGLWYQFIGGGTSIDRKKRLENFDWWKDEKFNYISKRVMRGVDVLVTHIAPREARPYHGMSDHPDIKNYQKNDPELRYDLGVENDEIQELFDYAPPRFWAFGHYHKNHVINIDNTSFLCLGIAELEMVALQPRNVQ